MTPSRLIASGCGCGFAPFAPGTVASAATLLPGALLLHISPALLAAAALVATLAGLWSIRAAHVAGDPGWVVIDEIAGQLLALWGLAHASVAGVLNIASRQSRALLQSLLHLGFSLRSAVPSDLPP